MIRKIKLEKFHYDIELKREINEIYLRSEVENFFSNFIRKDEAYKEIEKNSSLWSIRKYYSKFKIENIILGGNSDIFISKNDYTKLKSVCTTVSKKEKYNIKASAKVIANNLDYYTLDKVGDLLKLAKYGLEKLIKLKILIPVDNYNGIRLFSKKEIDELHKSQIRLLEDMKKNYYSMNDIKEKYGIEFSNYVRGKKHVDL